MGPGGIAGLVLGEGLENGHTEREDEVARLGSGTSRSAGNFDGRGGVWAGQVAYPLVVRIRKMRPGWARGISSLLNIGVKTRFLAQKTCDGEAVLAPLGMTVSLFGQFYNSGHWAGLEVPELIRGGRCEEA